MFVIREPIYDMAVVLLATNEVFAYICFKEGEPAKCVPHVIALILIFVIMQLHSRREGHSHFNYLSVTMAILVSFY